MFVFKVSKLSLLFFSMTYDMSHDVTINDDQVMSVVTQSYMGRERSLTVNTEQRKINNERDNTSSRETINNC